MTGTVALTYELFDIVWERHDENGPYTSTWTGFHTQAEAEEWTTGSASKGTVVRRTWTVEVAADDPLLPTMRERAIEVVG